LKYSISEKKIDQILREIYHTENFENIGKDILLLLANYLNQNLKQESPVLQFKAPESLQLDFDNKLPFKAKIKHSEFAEILNTLVLQNCLNIHHPRNLGHQVATPLPITALCDLVAAFTNQAMAIYETGPSATMIERQVIHWLCQLVDAETWAQGDGLLTSGGAQANLTALLAARQAYSLAQGKNYWDSGLNAQAPCFILTSEHCHYSVARAAGIMGLGTQAVIKIPCDNNGRMLLDALESQLNRYSGKVMAIVANAGCTPSGSIDALTEIGGLAQQHQVWLHIDGAHGASMLFSDKLRDKLQGIAVADSVVWDGHKLGYLPATVSAVLFKRGADSMLAFAQQASYLFDEENPDKAYDQSQRTLECTKRMMGLKWWAAFNLYGTQSLGKLVEHVFDTAQQMAAKIQQREDFELLMTPQTNIVVFRYLPYPQQAHIRKALVRSGKFHLTQVEWHGQTYLRATIMNPFTSIQDIADLLNEIPKTI
jgi:L-2,4-diaminobutyrate decarboxylase